MRKLYVTRDKAFAGSLGKVKIYIEDSNFPELNISGVPCRFLGALKNGESAAYDIDNASRRVYAIQDKASRSFCNEYITIPEGEFDISLAGKNELNPAAGNAFRFYNNNDIGALENRKKNKKTGWIITAVAIVIGVVVGVISSNGLFDSDKKFKVKELTITLTDNFEKRASFESDGYFESDEVLVYVDKIEKEHFETGASLTDAARELVSLADISSSVKINEEGGLVWVEFSEKEDGEKYFYKIYFYESHDAFWTVEFLTFDEYKDEYKSRIVKWAKSVKIETTSQA